MITSKKLGEQLGLAQATVSMALNDHPEISLATRRRVQLAAARANYVPSRIARAMRTGKSLLVGVIVPNFYVSYQPAIITGIEGEARRVGYQCLICQSHADPAIFRREVDVLVEHRVDGLVIAPFDSASCLQIYAHLQKIARPFAIVDMEMDSRLHADCATNDNLAVGRLAADHLIRLGHRRILCLRDWSASLNMVRRFDGAIAAMREQGIVMAPQLIRERGQGDWDVDRAVGEVLAQGVSFTALIAPDDHVAVKAMLALQSCGLRVPEDVSVIGCGDHDMAALVSPALTTIDQDAAGQGRAAFGLLLDRMAHPDIAPRAVRVAARLVIRASTAPVQESKTRVVSAQPQRRGKPRAAA